MMSVSRSCGPINGTVGCLSAAKITVLGIALSVAAPVVLVEARTPAQDAADAVGQTARSSSAGPEAESCGVPSTPARGKGAIPIFPSGKYPVSLPAVSLLGARNDLPNPFDAGVDWGQLPPGRKWGLSPSVTVAPDGTIWVVERCGNSHESSGITTCLGEKATIDPILQFDTSGKLLKSFGAGRFVSPHKLTIDSAGNLWVTDIVAQQVYKLTPDGKVLLTLGKKGVTGAGIDEFDSPTEVAIAPNGDIFVADGHTGAGTAVGNARIVKFDKNGKFLQTWGKKGMGPGEFDVPHTLAFDSRGRLFVGDRQNNRIQIFTQDGQFIAQWFQFSRPSGLYIDKKTDTLYVTDSESRDGRTNIGQLTLAQTASGFNPGARRGIRIGSARDGSVKYLIPDPCPYPYAGQASLAEGVTADAAGDVYGADVNQTVRKFIRRRH